MSSASSGLLCHCGPSLPAMWASPGHKMPMKEGQQKSHHHYAILLRHLLHLACSLCCIYSQGKGKCPSSGQTLPLQDSKALQGRESVGARCCCACRELAVPWAYKGEMTAMHLFQELLSIPPPSSSSEGWQQHRVEIAVFQWKLGGRFCCGRMKSQDFLVE